MIDLYRYFDEDGSLLYVGVSYSAVKRLVGHKGAANWTSEIRSITIEKFEDRDLALRAESIAIKDEAPRHNKMSPEIQKFGPPAPTSRQAFLRDEAERSARIAVENAVTEANFARINALRDTK